MVGFVTRNIAALHQAEKATSPHSRSLQLPVSSKALNEGYLKVPEDFTIIEMAPTRRYVKVVVAAFNQEKALLGTFSVISNLQMDLRFKL